MNDTICHYSGTKYIVVGVLHSFSAAISFAASLLVITIIILFKKLRFFSQRLIFYLSLTVALYSLATAAVKTDYVVISPQTDRYCEWIAFASQYTQWSLLLAVSVITTDILVRILGGDNHPNQTSGFNVEFFYIVIIFIVPGLFNWLPFYWNLYGISGDWCWIRDRIPNSDGSKCVVDDKARAFQFGLWYGPLFVFCCLILVTYIAIVYLLRRQRRRISIYNPEKIQLLRNMRNEIYSIFWYPIVFMIINVFPLTNRIVSSITGEPIFVLWVLHALISPLQGGFMSVVYALDPETRRSLTWSSIRGACIDFCHCQSDHEVSDYHAVIGTERGDINERSVLLKKSMKNSKKV